MITKEYVYQFVLSFIEKKAKLPKNVDIETFNYIDSGYVDSIGIIGFILDLESEFDIEISEEDMLSLDFRTVGGVAAIIYSKLEHNI